MERTAKFSPCGQYRLWLRRTLNCGNGTLAFIGLNPSTANEKEDDPTIRRIMAFTEREGYYSCLMLNLFCLVSKDPKVLLKHPDPLGEADFQLKTIRETGFPVVFCWGAFPEAKKRAEEVTKMFPNALCFGKTKEGHPKHPLYLASNTPLVRFSNEQ